MPNVIRIAGIVQESIVDGPGIRYTVFAQGCTHRCEGCHNPETHNPDGGSDIKISEILRQIDGNSLLDGVTLSGGGPLVPPEVLLALARAARERGLSVMVYSGYTFEEIMSDEKKCRVMDYTDILVDGRFEKASRSLSLDFRGSLNQRVIDVPASLEKGVVVLWAANV